jgi:hypothetical protein
MPRYNDTDPSELPEVQAYIEAVDMLNAFRDQHPKIFEAYGALVDDMNQKLQAADKAVRAKGVSCGPWEHYQNQEKFDPQALYEALGRDDFLKVGGVLQTVTTYGLDKNKLKAAAVNGDVPEEVMEQVRTITPKYHAPKGIDR